MSEQLLEAIIHLFSMLARLDGVGEKERSKMFNLLTSRLNKEIVGKYMDMFDDFCKKDFLVGKTSFLQSQYLLGNDRFWDHSCAGSPVPIL